MSSPLLSRKVQMEAASPVRSPSPNISDNNIDNNLKNVFMDDSKQDEDFPKYDEIPEISSRAGFEDENGAKIPAVAIKGIPGQLFPYPPSLRTDAENGLADLDVVSIPDVNVYQHKKTLAQGMMDLALFSANANQLRYVLDSSRDHPYFYPNVVFITISVILQVAIGAGLVWNATYNVKDDKEICIANKINNFTVVGIFLVTVINVFICAFGVAVTQVTPVT